MSAVPMDIELCALPVSEPPSSHCCICHQPVARRTVFVLVGDTTVAHYACFSGTPDAVLLAR